MRTEIKFQYKLTEFLSQFEMNAEMDISKNQWRSTGGKIIREDFRLVSILLKIS